MHLKACLGSAVWGTHRNPSTRQVEERQEVTGVPVSKNPQRSSRAEDTDK